ncbi:LacI family DNA-binding transcriptional regulator [Arthrobacter sp. PAMC 25486]|uniref:LacI family DNA-binding transcriptional regulator n=1 Tax=Arthrobacter sp. PAMC 25486 TaxID=1494608 RepID=UPI00056F4D27|nr:LacI family DNA-binding transcriptional regulator [Arthrobacter sp. PAMC 25486]
MRNVPTIVQLAKRLGVAPSTVSRAYTNPGLLRTETVQRVMAAAAELGYVPNNHARALITGKSGVIGLIVPDIANPFFPPIIRHAQLAAEELGLSVFIADTDGDADREVTMIGRLSPQVDGLIIAASRLPEKSLTTIAQRMPTVLINRDVDKISRVLVSATEALAEGINHFVRGGHTRIAYVEGPPKSWSNMQRLTSVTQAMNSHGLDGIFLQAPAGTFTDGVDASAMVVESGATAVIAFDDVIAHGLMSGFRERGLRIPDDICILGCDDTLAITTFPSLSSITLDLAKAGRIAVEALRNTQPKRGVIEKRIELEGNLVLRGTTG